MSAVYDGDGDGGTGTEADYYGLVWYTGGKKGLQSRFVKAINPGFRNRD
jgi:hypothetical protein